MQLASLRPTSPHVAEAKARALRGDHYRSCPEVAPGCCCKMLPAVAPAQLRPNPAARQCSGGCFCCCYCCPLPPGGDTSRGRLRCAVTIAALRKSPVSTNSGAPVRGRSPAAFTARSSSQRRKQPPSRLSDVVTVRFAMRMLSRIELAVCWR